MRAAWSLQLISLLCGVSVLGILWSAALARATPPEPAPQQYMAQGWQAYHAGDFVTAVSHWQAAAQLYERAHQASASSLALTSLAQAYEALGHYDEALQSLHTAQRFAEQTEDQLQHATILASLGQLFLVTGAPEQAEQSLRDALRMAQTLGDAGLQAVILNNLGNLVMARLTLHMADFDTALEFYQQSASLAQHAQHDAMAARALIHTVMVALRAYAQGYIPPALQPPALRPQLAQAFAALQRTAPSHTKAYDLLNAGLASAQLRPYLPEVAPDLERQAAEVFSEAAAVAQALHNQQAASYAWGHLGHLYEDAQRYPEALHLTQRAVFAAQQVQAPDALYRWQWQSGRLLQALQRRDAAISTYQHAVETLQSLRGALPCAYGKDQPAFRTAFGALFFGFVDLLLQRAAASPESSQAKTDLEQARLTMEQFKKAELQDYLGDMCVGTGATKVTALEDVAATAAIVYPIPLPDRLELLVGIHGELRRFQVAVTADKLESVATGFRQAVQDGKRTYQQLAQTLYTWLIRPFEAALVSGGVRTVVFVPDGVLRTIPLAALHDGQHFLIEKYALVITPGLHLTDPQPLRPETLRVLAAGVTHSPGATFADLPYVTQELQAIAQLFPGRVHQLAEFRLAELETAWQQGRFTIMHIASHGVFAGDAAHSFLVTADGMHVTMGRLAQLVGRVRVHQEPLALLTLSACDTALGDGRAALGLAGVAVQAGARSVLATLWQVQDQVTADLVTTFYTHLQQPGVSRAQALQQAQVALLTQGTAYTRHPYYWAAFLLINNWL